MTVLQRAATIASLSLFACLLGFSTQGSAQMLAAAPLTVFNTPDTIVVPQGDQAVTADMLATATPEEFDSLADAVAAHDGDVASDAIRCLAGAVYFEAKGEPLAGQLAVAEVILNRARSGRFPPDVCGVVLQRGQFGFVRAGQIPAIDTGCTAYRTAIAVARVALAHAWDGPADEALYFNTPGNRPAARLTRIAAVGNHVFYR